MKTVGKMNIVPEEAQSHSTAEVSGNAGIVSLRVDD
jgi:hypothetical protein